MEEHRVFRVVIPLALSLFFMVSLSSGGEGGIVRNLQTMSTRQDTIDSVRVYSTQAFYGERGRRLHVRLRNVHLSQGLEFKVAASSQNPLYFTGHHAISELEPNDDCVSAQLVNATQFVNASIDSLGDEDFCQFYLDVTDPTVMRLSAGRGAAPGYDDVDTIRMWLYEPDCLTERAYAEDSLEAGVEIVDTFTTPGEYYYRVRIAGTGNDTGDYTFFINDTLFYEPPDTFPWGAETSVLPSSWNLRTNVISDSASSHMLGIGDPETRFDPSSEWRYIFSYNFDVDPWIIKVSGSPPEIDTVFPDTFVVVNFTRAVVSDTNGVSHFAETIPCTVWISAQATGGFIRGDLDTIPGIFMSDAIYMLRALYVPGADEPPCWDASDANDDGDAAMSDAVYLLKWLYVPNEPPPPPPTPSLKSSPDIYPGDCGSDPTADQLGCDAHGCMGSSF